MQIEHIFARRKGGKYDFSCRVYYKKIDLKNIKAYAKIMIIAV